MKEHFESGLAVAKFLEQHPAITKVVHPMLPSHPDHQLAVKQQKGNKTILNVYSKMQFFNSIWLDINSKHITHDHFYVPIQYIFFSKWYLAR